MDLPTYSRATFEPLLGDTFEVKFADGQVLNLTLTQIRDTPKPAENYDSFALLFKGPSDLTFNQGLILMTHPQKGDYSVFMVPVENSDDGLYYEAVFNLNQEDAP